jgi:hypothetical protein
MMNLFNSLQPGRRGKRRLLVLGLTATLGFGFAAAPQIAIAGPALTQQAKVAKAPSAFPALSVVDIKSGKRFKLASLANTKKATLLWFWAPH